MIAEALNAKLREAADTVQVWVNTGNGQAGFDWQYEQLMKYKDTAVAQRLAQWWAAHPANA